MNEKDYELTIQVDSLDSVLQLVQMGHKHYEQGGKNACVNINQYIAAARNLGFV